MPEPTVLAWRARLRAAAGPLVVLAIVLASVWLRLRNLPQARVDRDSVYPAYDAWLILSGQRLATAGRAAPVFTYGYLQPWLLVPVVATVATLRQLFVVQAVLHGLVPLPVALAARRAGGWAAALGAAFITAFLPILAMMPSAGSSTYQAPVLAALATLAGAVALQRRSPAWVLTWALCLAAAILVHPYSLALLVGALPLLPAVLRIQGPRLLAMAILAGGLALAPMAHDNLERMGRGQGLEEVDRAMPALPVDNPDVRGGPLARLFWTTAGQGGSSPLWAGLALAAVPLLAAGALGLRHRRRTESVARGLRHWALGTAAAAGAIGLGLGYLRDYHLAIFAPLTAAALAPTVAHAVERWAPSWRSSRPGQAGWAVVGALVVWAVLQTLGQTGPRIPVYGPATLKLAVADGAAKAIDADAGQREAWIGVLTEAETVPGIRQPPQTTSVLPFTLARFLSGHTRMERPPPLPPGGAGPRAYLVVEVAAPLWMAWLQRFVLEHPGDAGSMRVLGGWPGRPGTLVRLAAFDDARVAGRWIRSGCEVTAGSRFVVDGPIDREDLQRRYRVVDPINSGWPGLCPQVGEIPWWAASGPESERSAPP